MDEHEIHRFKLEQAYRVGYTGERAVNFANRLTGSTAEEIQVDADHLEAVFAEWRASAVPPPDRPTDHTQGIGPSSAPRTPADDFSDMINDHFRGIR